MSHHHHHHHHDHGHHHPDGPPNKAFAIGLVLNLGFVIVEFGYGAWAGSLALVADAGHNLSDVLSLLLAWGASLLAGFSSTRRRTYGYSKATVFASLLSALLLLVALGGIAWEALVRLRQPAPVAGGVVITVAAIGVVINTLTALLFAKGSKEDLNLRGVYLHMAADAAVSLGVVLSGLLILYTNWLWVDPVVSLGIVVVIFVGTWHLLRDSANYAMDAVPPGIDLDEIRALLLEQPGATDIHDLHVWPLSTTETALTVHLVVDHEGIDNDFLHGVQLQLQQRFRIGHATIQLEHRSGLDDCLLHDGKCWDVRQPRPGQGKGVQNV